MDRNHKELLTKNRYQLGKELWVDDDFLNMLQGDRIINNSMREEIEAAGEKKGPKRRSSVLLDILPKRGPNALPCFVRALRETGQDHLAVLLDNAPGSSTPVSQQRPPHSRGRPDPGAACDVSRSSRRTALRRTISHPSDEPSIEPPLGHIDTPHENPEDRETYQKYVMPSGSQSQTPLQGLTETSAVKRQLQQESGSISGQYKSIETLDTKQTFVNISIIQPESSEYRSHLTKKDYEIVEGSRGVAIIIEAEKNQFIRDGINIEQLLNDLNYKVEITEVKAGEEIVKILESKRTMEALEGCHSLICYIFVDSGQNSLNLETMCRMFDDQSCPSLTGKPRVFIIQHSNRDIGTTCVATDDVDEMGGEESSGKSVAAITSGLEQLTTTDPPDDMLVAYAQCIGTYEEDYSSFMVLAVVQVFMMCAYQLTIDELLQEVEDLIKRTDEIKPGAFSMKVMNRLQKTMYLLPPPKAADAARRVANRE